MAKYLFKVGSHWKDKYSLESYSALTGFTTAKEASYSIKCDRSGSSHPSTKQRDFASGLLKIGCIFKITTCIESTVREKKMPKIVSAKSKPNKYRDNFENDIPVFIKKACCDHVEGCNPCPQQQMMTRSRGVGM
mmetsp:Transcript_16773/g.19395  ORF Transcript_16773/g.19395 Transcript_16773/m.19395 type:complete len:134 (-) Transcript_16773:7-408(-)